ncbi:MAG: hypothetical protein KH415_22285 [Clostridium sp.]|nr:hypothetical protein [Clostridium sp.]
MKKLKKISLFMVGLLFLAFVPLKANAATENDEHLLVNKYLTALKDSDVVSVIELSNDTRAKNKMEYQVWLNEILQDPNQQISEFKILDKDIKSDNYSIVYAEVEFLNGDVFEVPFRVQDGIVYIDKKDNLLKIKEGIEIPYSAPSTRAQVVYWDMTLSLQPNNADTQYTSNFTYNANYTTLNFRQYTGSSAPVAAKVEYAIVKRSLFGDTVYASKLVSGDNSSAARQITLSLGTGQTFNNLCIRVDNYNYSYTTYSYGEAYCY